MAAPLGSFVPGVNPPLAPIQNRQHRASGNESGGKWTFPVLFGTGLVSTIAGAALVVLACLGVIAALSTPIGLAIGGVALMLGVTVLLATAYSKYCERPQIPRYRDRDPTPEELGFEKTKDGRYYQRDAYPVQHTKSEISRKDEIPAELEVLLAPQDGDS